MILSFRNSMTRIIATGRAPKGFPTDILKRAMNKLTVLEYAKELDDLRWPPGNRLERLSGNRDEQHSIRINDQWRICFIWTNAGPESVEIVDYH